MSIAKQLQDTASNHSGDLGGLLWDAGAKILQLEDENAALRAQLSEKNIGQGVPEEGDLLTIAYLHGFAKGKEAAHNIGEKK